MVETDPLPGFVTGGLVEEDFRERLMVAKADSRADAKSER